MRNYIMSVTALAIGALFVVSQPSSLSPTSNTDSDLVANGRMGNKLKIQQAHLRTIDPFDIQIIPTYRPVPENVPLGSMFGMRLHPILKENKMHKGVDFPAPTGTPILASATGKVGKLVAHADSSSYGKHVVIFHDEEYCTLYAHMSIVNVMPEQIVEQGDTIGFIGSTGRSTNPHLHYEVIKDGIRMNPREYF